MGKTKCAYCGVEKNDVAKRPLKGGSMTSCSSCYKEAKEGYWILNIFKKEK